MKKAYFYRKNYNFASCLTNVFESAEAGRAGVCGSGKRAKLPGYRVGGKTATSEKLPRSLKKYISSFLGFAPADDPQVIALITIDEPVGIYYGGTIAAPVVADIYSNILPYLDITSVSETD